MTCPGRVLGCGPVQFRRTHPIFPCSINDQEIRCPLRPITPKAQAGSSKQFAVLLLGAIGVVYGDIGTSPLYAFREALRPFAHDGVTPDEVIGLRGQGSCRRLVGGPSAWNWLAGHHGRHLTIVFSPFVRKFSFAS